MSMKTGNPSSQMFLDELQLDSSGTIVVMLCRIWDINASSNGRYLGTEFLISDAKVCKICTVTKKLIISIRI